MTTRAAILLLCFLAFAAPARALSFCMEPTPPTCVDSLDTYGTSDQWEFDSCRSEIENFKQELESYIDCLKDKIDDLIAEYNALVRKYNCKARREGFCY